MFVGSPEGRQWRKLLEVMGDPAWAKDPRLKSRTVMNNEHGPEVDGYMEEWLTKHTKAELLQIALDNRIPLAPVRGFDEVRYDPSLADLFVEIERSDTGPISYPGVPYDLSNGPASEPRPAPFLGQHNKDVLCGVLEYSGDKLTALENTGIV